MNKIVIFSLTLILISCTDNKSKMIQNIKSLESNKNYANSDSLIKTYINFAEKFKDDKYALNYLFKAAEMQVKQQKFNDGAKLYEQVAETYPDSTLASESIFRAANIYQMIDEKNKCKNLYKKFISKYPNHERNEEIKLILETIDLPKEVQDSIYMDRILKKNPDLLQ